MRKTLLATILAAGLIGCYQEHTSQDRSQNAIAAITTGIALHQTYGAAKITGNLGRPGDFDSTFSGRTDSQSIEITLDLPYQNSIFKGSIDGQISGTQDKMLFDWNISELAPGQYMISRVGFDGKLQLQIRDGEITGSYSEALLPTVKLEGRMNDGRYLLEMKAMNSYWELTGDVTDLPDE